MIDERSIDNPDVLAELKRAFDAYERTLITPGPFDKYLQGDAAALGRARRPRR